MVGMEILKPLVVLAGWTMVMWVWMYVTRIPAMGKAGIDSKGLVGGTGESLDKVLPPEVQWKSHNYTHLMEQPTIFHATVMILALMGASATDVALAWGYVALRIVHSIWQATVNKVSVRFALFNLSTICLLVMAIHGFTLTALHTGGM